jgi:acyl phosphate:glycerol-3-phosphate acyltransferase
MRFFVIGVFSYLLGSIPFGLLLVRIFRGQDVRQTGSGNIGATNVARSWPGLGLLTLLLDAAKGFLAVYAAIAMAKRGSLGYYDPQMYPMMCLASLSAIVGHTFPVWLRFRGGKGVATALGSFVILAPVATLAAIGIFAVTLAWSRQVSLASMVAVILCPLMSWFLDGYRYRHPLDLILMVMASILIVAKHHQNISRLLAGTEPRFTLWRSKRA